MIPLPWPTRVASRRATADRSSRPHGEPGTSFLPLVSCQFLSGLYIRLKPRKKTSGRKRMSVAHAVAHGAFGRACLYELDRPMVPHAHREGHLIFHVRGPAAKVVIDGRAYPLNPFEATAISPWQPHYFQPVDRRIPRSPSFSTSARAGSWKRAARRRRSCGLVARL